MASVPVVSAALTHEEAGTGHGHGEFPGAQSLACTRKCVRVMAKGERAANESEGGARTLDCGHGCVEGVCSGSDMDTEAVPVVKMPGSSNTSRLLTWRCLALLLAFAPEAKSIILVVRGRNIASLLQAARVT